jgi:hypothetical protein
MNEQTALFDRIAALETQLARADAAREIQNLMGRYTVNFSPKYMHRAIDFYALDRQDVSVEIADRGVYVGAEALRRLFTGSFAMSTKGNLLIHYLATPMIEVAQDGQSARGVWRSPGIEAVVPPDGGKPVPLWSFGTYAVDFVRTNGEWKILHLHWFRTIKCSYEKAWVDDLSMTYTGKFAEAPDILPTTFHYPFTPETTQEPIPPCPLPYETLTNADWMVQESHPEGR